VVVRKPRNQSRQRWIVIALLVTVILIDQATKWWGWRHVAGPIINPGSDVIAGEVVGHWYEDPLAGAFLDLFGLGLLTTALLVLIRRRRPAAVHVPATLLIGGWGSNQLDRLGMHIWTAPGSVRGAVDFIAVGHYRYNLADVFIVGGTLLLLSSIGYLLGRGAYDRPRPERGTSNAPQLGERARTSV
jgi:lipoprotein signal peptidase